MPDIELLYWTLSPSVVTLEQPALLTGKLWNVTGEAIKGYKFSLLISEQQFGIERDRATIVDITDFIPVNWKKGAMLNLNQQISLSETYNGKNYAVTFRDYQARGNGAREIDLIFQVTFERGSGGFSSLNFTIGKALDYHSNLSIPSFSIVRAFGSVEDDEGTTARTTLKISAGAAAVVSTLSLKLYYTNNGTATTSDPFVDLTSDIPTLLSATGPTAYNLLVDQLSTTDNWSFLLVFTDGYEPAQQSTTISRAFANVHMSGASTGGVAFGKFSAATDQNPLFECVYPAVFSGDVTVPEEGLLKTVPVTVTSAQSVSASSTANYTAAVGAGAGWTPIGIVGYNYNSRYMTLLRAYINSDNEAACTIFNGDSSARSVTIVMYVLCLRTG